jgi:hypothetical protein
MVGAQKGGSGGPPEQWGRDGGTRSQLQEILPHGVISKKTGKSGDIPTMGIWI